MPSMDLMTAKGARKPFMKLLTAVLVKFIVFVFMAE